MRTALLLVGLLLLASCGSTDPWDTTGWRNEQMDYETDFWVPIDEGETTASPTPTRPQPTRPAAQPAPVWTQPAPGGTPPPPPPPSWPATTTEGQSTWRPVEPVHRGGFPPPPPPR